MNQTQFILSIILTMRNVERLHPAVEVTGSEALETMQNCLELTNDEMPSTDDERAKLAAQFARDYGHWLAAERAEYQQWHELYGD